MPPTSCRVTPSRTSSPGPSASTSISRSWWPAFASSAPSLRCGSASAAERLDRAGAGDHDVRVGQRVRERRDAVAVEVRLERRDRVDLDDGYLAADALGVAREPLADPAVADHAEALARAREVRQPQDRGDRRLAGAVAVVVQVLRPGVVRGHGRERQLPVGLERAQAQHARRRLLAHAAQPRDEVGPLPDDPRRQLGAVVDDDLWLEIGRGEQVGLELVGARSADARAPRSRAARAPRRRRPGSSSRSRPPRPRARRRPRTASRGMPSSPPGARRRRPGDRRTSRPRAAPARAGSAPASAGRPTRSAPRPRRRGPGRGSATARASTPRRRRLTAGGGAHGTEPAHERVDHLPLEQHRVRARLAHRLVQPRVAVAGQRDQAEAR